jgi:hypothetical protein
MHSTGERVTDTSKRSDGVNLVSWARTSFDAFPDNILKGLNMSIHRNRCGYLI